MRNQSDSELASKFEGLRRRQAAMEKQLAHLRVQNRVTGEALATHLRLRGGSDLAEFEKQHLLANSVSEILGGVASSGQFPQVASILPKYNWHGSGVLIAPRVVLTAAHALTPVPTAVALDTLSMPPPDAKKIAVKAFDHAPAFTGNGGHDIGFLALEVDSWITPIALASTQELLNASEVTLVGFGFDESGKNHVQRNVTTEILFGAGKTTGTIPQDVLEAGFDDDAEFLVGVAGIGATLGDSGGPALVETTDGFKLAGIISRGPKTEFTGVTIIERIDVDLEWIQGVINKFSGN